MKEKEKNDRYSDALVAMYDYLKMVDNEIIEKSISIEIMEINEETLTEMFFRKLNAYNIDLNKLCGFTHLKAITKQTRSFKDEK